MREIKDDEEGTYQGHWRLFQGAVGQTLTASDGGVQAEKVGINVYLYVLRGWEMYNDLDSLPKEEEGDLEILCWQKFKKENIKGWYFDEKPLTPVCVPCFSVYNILFTTINAINTINCQWKQYDKYIWNDINEKYKINTINCQWKQYEGSC